MMRYLGNTFAKLQYREFSSVSEKVTGTKIVGYCFTGVFFCGGYVLAGLISPPVSKQVQETEEMVIKKLERLGKHKSNLEALMKE
ncbi:unnamed protein product [Arabidopsis halleri]